MKYFQRRSPPAGTGYPQWNIDFDQYFFYFNIAQYQRLVAQKLTADAHREHMMKALHTLVTVSILTGSTSVSAWWGPFDDNDYGHYGNRNYSSWDSNRYNNQWHNDNWNRWDNNVFSDIMNDVIGDMSGDMDIEIKFKIRGKGRGDGRGYGSNDNYWSHRYNNYYRYHNGNYYGYYSGGRHPGYTYPQSGYQSYYYNQPSDYRSQPYPPEIRSEQNPDQLQPGQQEIDEAAGQQ